MKVVLVALHSLRSYSVPYLHALLDREGHDVKSVFFKLTTSRATERDVRVFVDLIEELAPQVVGFSVMSTFFRIAARLTHLVRERTNAFVVWGGIHPTVCPEECLDHADAICVGEGEGALLELLAALDSGSDYREIQNIWTKTNGEIRKNPMRPLVEDLDAMPFPDYTRRNKFYVDSGKLVQGIAGEDVIESYRILMSRGCVHRCHYCCNSLLSHLYKGLGPYVRRRSVDSVIAELEGAKAIYKNVSTISVIDDSFMFDRAWLQEFSEKYSAKIRLLYGAYTHPNLVKEEFIKLLAPTGFFYTIMGIQSGSERIRKEYYNRHTPNEQIIRAGEIFREYGLMTCYDLIVQCPYETEEDRLATLELLTSLPRPYQLDPFPLQFFPGTAITERALRDGKIRPEDVENVAERGYDVWCASLHLNQPRSDMRWDVLYFLAKKKRVSKPFLMRLVRSSFFARHIKGITRILRLLPIDNYQFHQVMIDNVIQRVYHGIYTMVRVPWQRNLKLLSRHFKYLLLLLRQRLFDRKKPSTLS